MKKIFQYVAILVAGLSLMACDLLPGQSKGGGLQQSRKRRNQVPYQLATKR